MNIVLLTNILTPFRKAFYDELNVQCKKQGHVFHVLVMTEREFNRQWHYEEYKGEYSILLKSRSIRIKHIPFYFNPDLKEQLKKLSPDVVIMAGGYMLPSVWTACGMKRKLGYRTYFWSESHFDETREYNKILLKIRDSIRHKIYPQFNGFWYPGEKALKLIKTYAKPDAECFWVPNLIENSKFKKVECGLSVSEIRKKYGIDEEKFVFFAPSRLSWEKGLEPFIKLLAKCDDAIKNRIQLVDAGDGDLEKQLRQCAEEQQVDLKLLGYCNEKQVIELYQGVDCFVMPSLSDASPLSCVEALWMGLPLLVSEHVGNHPEVVEQGKNGYVYSYSDEEEAIRIIEKIVLSDENWYTNARAVSTKKAQEQFELAKTTKRLLQEMKIL